MSPSEYRELVEFLGRRFDEIDRRFDGIDARLDGIDARLNGIDARLDGMDARLDGMDARLNGIDARVNGIEGRLRKVEVGQEGLRDLIKLNAEAILSLDEKLDRFRQEVAIRFDRLEYRVDRLEVA